MFKALLLLVVGWLINSTIFAANSGCDHLKVMIYNTTNYTFIPSPTPVFTNGAVTDNLTNIPPQNSQTQTNGQATANIIGSYLNNTQWDEISGNLYYYATINGQALKDVTLTINVKKSSCNLSQALTCDKHTECVESLTKEPVDCSACDYWLACDKRDTYFPHCDNVPATITNTTTGGALGRPDIVYYSQTTNIDPILACSTLNKSNCDHTTLIYPTGTNVEGYSTFTIYPTVLTQLIITFPFNNQTPLAQTMLHAVYDNLNPFKLKSLTAFRVAPVALDVQKETVTFSALCTQSTCAVECSGNSCPHP